MHLETSVLRAFRLTLGLALLGATALIGGCSSDAGGAAVAAADAGSGADAAFGSDAGADAALASDAGADTAAVASDTASDTAAADASTVSDVTTGCVPSAASTAPKTLGGARPAKVYVPKTWDGCTKLPLVILLHGYGASGGIQDAYLGVSARVDKLGFIAVVPDGTVSKIGKQFWNATNACCDFDGQKIDDVAYLRGLITEAHTALAVDPERVYFYGHSNGGFMSYRMACEASDLVTGIASLAGAVANNAALCKPARPVSVLQIHGTLDATIAYQGNLYYPSAIAAEGRWLALNGCTGALKTEDDGDFDNGVPGAETSRRFHDECDEGTWVGLWTMTGSGHIPQVTQPFNDAVLEQVLAWRRQP
jgi:polyhydroxybutyrate depolymerase